MICIQVTIKQNIRHQMKYKVNFTATNRPTPIRTNYRPDWISDSKPEYNCAQLIFTDKYTIGQDESHDCILEPFASQLWSNVQVGDVLKCMEGITEVGTATVLEII